MNEKEGKGQVNDPAIIGAVIHHYGLKLGKEEISQLTGVPRRVVEEIRTRYAADIKEAQREWMQPIDVNEATATASGIARSYREPKSERPTKRQVDCRAGCIYREECESLDPIFDLLPCERPLLWEILILKN